MDVVSVLEQLSERGLVRLNKVSNNYYQIYCPFHANGEEQKPSFGVLLHEEVKDGQKYPEGWCHCFACSYVGTLPEMVTKILQSRSITQSGVDWLVENIPGFESDDVEFEFLLPRDTLEILSSQFAAKKIQTQKQKVSFVTEEELAKYRYTIQYMYDRKLTDTVIEKYDVGFQEDWVAPGRHTPTPCVTFPVRDRQGRTLFVARRSVEGKFFNYPTGVTKPVYGLYELPRNTKSVVICESMFNCLTAVVYGYNAVALMGTGNTYQIKQLREFGVRDFVICMDGDEAGRRATEKLRRQLNDVAVVWYITMPEGKDLNDCTKDEFDELYDSRD